MYNFLHNFWFVQGIGVLGLIFSILSWNSSTRKKILELQSVNSILFFIHYILLGAFPGAVMNLVSLARNQVFVRKDNQKWASYKAWFYVFILLSLLGLTLSWQGTISILPAVGVIIGTYGVYQENPARIRFLILIACFVWIPYTIVVKSYPGLVSQLVAISGILLGMYRHDRRNILINE